VVSIRQKKGEGRRGRNYLHPITDKEEKGGKLRATTPNAKERVRSFVLLKNQSILRRTTNVHHTGGKRGEEETQKQSLIHEKKKTTNPKKKKRPRQRQPCYLQ